MTDVVEFVVEDVAVVVAVAHCHVSCFDDETLYPDNQCHGRNQGLRQRAMFVEVQKVETQRDELPLMK